MLTVKSIAKGEDEKDLSTLSCLTTAACLPTLVIDNNNEKFETFSENLSNRKACQQFNIFHVDTLRA
jgi:hypothetical protein